MKSIVKMLAVGIWERERSKKSVVGEVLRRERSKIDI
jgi:hypothetical protein